MVVGGLGNGLSPKHSGLLMAGRLEKTRACNEQSTEVFPDHPQSLFMRNPFRNCVTRYIGYFPDGRETSVARLYERETSRCYLYIGKRQRLCPSARQRVSGFGLGISKKEDSYFWKQAFLQMKLRLEHPCSKPRRMSVSRRCLSFTTTLHPRRTLKQTDLGESQPRG